LPPAFAARLRVVLLAVEPDRALDLRAVDPELRELALDLRAVDLLAVDLPAVDLPAVDLRAVDLRAVGFRALDPLLRELALLRALEPRELDPDDLRADPPPDERLRDDEEPLLLPLFDSAIAFLLLRSLQLHFCCAPHYFMRAAAVTYA
jgi:hypothetical protein